MKLSDWIENKESELTEVNGFRKAAFKNIEECQISRNITSTIFTIGEQKVFDNNMEVEEVNRNDLTNEKIDALQVCFDVVKPRCRKPKSFYAYVTAI